MNLKVEANKENVDLHITNMYKEDFDFLMHLMLNSGSPQMIALAQCAKERLNKIE